LSDEASLADPDRRYPSPIYDKHILRYDDDEEGEEEDELDSEN